jgi:hypothetical protein
MYKMYAYILRNSCTVHAQNILVEEKQGSIRNKTVGPQVILSSK